MRITIIYDNVVYKEGLQDDWGFSCLVEIENTPTILFDTGANGSYLLYNMAKLHIDPNSIDEVFISHSHFDHVGGLSVFLNVKKDVNIVLHSLAWVIPDIVFFREIPVSNDARAYKSNPPQ